MQDRLKLNSGINQLKQIFDIIEPYDPNDNIGYRSLKNIGVWLIAYALTEKSQQLEVVRDLLSKADMLAEIKTIKETIDLLSKSANVTSIINDYAKANGKFDIIINNPARLAGLKAQAKAAGLSEIVEKHLKVDESNDADLTFDMNNTIKFSWQDNRCRPAKFAQGKKIAFANEDEINYLTANSKDHSVAYDLVKLDNDFYHVVRFDALQNDEKDQVKQTAVYLIEPTDQKMNQLALQKNYFDIVNLFKQKGGYEERYDEIKAIEKKASQKNLKITELVMSGEDADEDRTEFNFIVNFPELAKPLKTHEERLGIYSSFLKKTIGSFYAENLAYLGERELEYDAKGGTVKNRERLSTFESCMMHRSPAKTVTIEYTTQGPYLMVYEANGGADYYAFKITHPRKDLEKSFGSSAKYVLNRDHLPQEDKTAHLHAKQPFFSPNRYELRSKTLMQNQGETLKNDEKEYNKSVRLH